VSQVDFQKAEKLITHYSNEFFKKFKSRPIMNRNKTKFLVIDMLRDITITQAKKLVDYFISHSKEEPEFIELLYNYGDIMKEMDIEVVDKKHREQLLSETEKAVRDFRERYKRS
jgi:hypothetical protein